VLVLSFPLQDCLVGLLFALMPVLGAAGGGDGFDVRLLLTVMGRVLGKLAVLAAGAALFSRLVLPFAMRALSRRARGETFQLAAIAFCMLCALCTARQGVSAELGAFVAGVMLSATEQQEAVLHNIGAARCCLSVLTKRCAATLHVCACRLPGTPTCFLPAKG
jgi:Kef-type K+ transport system membrane component KefB